MHLFRPLPSSFFPSMGMREGTVQSGGKKTLGCLWAGRLWRWGLQDHTVGRVLHSYSETTLSWWRRCGEFRPLWTLKLEGSEGQQWTLSVAWQSTQSLFLGTLSLVWFPPMFWLSIRLDLLETSDPRALKVTESPLWFLLKAFRDTVHEYFHMLLTVIFFPDYRDRCPWKPPQCWWETQIFSKGLSVFFLLLEIIQFYRNNLRGRGTRLVQTSQGTKLLA